MSALLDVTGVSKSFSGIRALDDISISVDLGERVGLIGPNGAGKTTFFNCILGVLRPDSGRVVFNGNDLGAQPVYRRARAGIGRTFQRIELFADMTVLDHLLLAERVHNRSGSFLRDIIGKGRAARAETDACHHVLELLGIRHLATSPIESLSLGTGRLVEVGRALMTEPKLLLLDEPSSGLDREETDVLANTLRSVQEEQGFAILLVEHDVDLVRSFTQRSYVLDNGRMIAQGDTTTVMEDAAVRAAYMGT